MLQSLVSVAYVSQAVSDTDIGIARALYHNPQVLILDEATSALDNITEHAVMKAVNNLGRKITIILIAHRLSTIRQCDQIYLLEGELKANGTYDQLISSCEGFQGVGSRHIMKKFLITGGAGFIGSAVIRHLIEETDYWILNLDKLTYASNLKSLESIAQNKRYEFVKGNICDHQFVKVLFNEYQPDIVMHLAAESHVDRSIDEPAEFIQTNIVGTLVMLECAREYWMALPTETDFRFHHISTDEVYEVLTTTNCFPKILPTIRALPYSASKASSDHLVRAWYRTYGLPILITNCSNNYGPYQYPEKLIPLMILNALERKPLPIYGNGQQIRDWLHVEDHARALL